MLAHGHAQAFQRRLVGQADALEGQPAVRVDVTRARGLQPGRPIVRPRHRLQQRVPAQVARMDERGAALQQARAAHRQQLDADQEAGDHARPVAAAHADGDVGVVLGEVHRLERGGEDGVAARMGGVERGQARYQPAHREGHRTPDVQRFVAHSLHGALGGLAYAVEHVVQVVQVASADGGQAHFAVDPLEQPGSQEFLQDHDLSADGAGRDVQFARGAREAQVARRHLEGAQRVQRGQASGHFL